MENMLEFTVSCNNKTKIIRKNNIKITITRNNDKIVVSCNIGLLCFFEQYLPFDKRKVYSIKYDLNSKNIPFVSRDEETKRYENGKLIYECRIKTIKQHNKIWRIINGIFKKNKNKD